MLPKEISRIETEIYALVLLCKRALDKSLDIHTEQPNVLDNIQRAAMYCAKACALREMLDELSAKKTASQRPTKLEPIEPRCAWGTPGCEVKHKSECAPKRYDSGRGCGKRKERST